MPCPLQGIFPTQGPNTGLLHGRQTLPSEPPGKTISMDWPSHLPRNEADCSLSGRKFPFPFLKDSCEPKRGDSVESEMRCYFRAEVMADCSLSGRKFPFPFLRDSCEPKRGDSVESEMRCYFRAEASEFPCRAVDPGLGNTPTTPTRLLMYVERWLSPSVCGLNKESV